MTKEEIKQLLLPAERQYQHNDCSGLLRGYDYKKVIEILSSQLEPLVMPKIAEILSDKIKDAYMGQQALQNGGLTEEQENFEFIINDVIIKTLTSLKEEISNFSV